MNAPNLYPRLKSACVLFGMALLALCATGCKREPYEVEFCGVRESARSRPNFVIDLSGGRVFGTDTAATIEVVRSDAAIGFVSPFPLSLPSDEALRQSIPLNWTLGEFLFTASAFPSANPGWILIHAEPRDRTDDRYITDESSVLYSMREGVLAIRLVSKADGREVASEFLFCGNGALKASDLNR